MQPCLYLSSQTNSQKNKKMKKITFIMGLLLYFVNVNAQLNNPTILVQPQDQTDLCPFQWVQYVIVGTNIDSYQWQVSSDSGNTWTDITDDYIQYFGSTDDTLNVFATSSVNNYFYRCIAYGSSEDSVISDPAVLQLETQPPVIQTYNTPVDVYIDMFGTTNIMFSDVVSSASDNCGIVDSTVNPSQFDCSYVGDTVQVVVSASDMAGNIAYDTAYVVVHDTTPPTGITNPLGMAYINDTGAAIVDPSLLLLSASDNCQIADTTIYPTSFSCSDAGSQVYVNIILTDVYGNSDTLQAPVMIMDTIAPQIQCVNDTVINLPAGDTSYVVNGTFLDPTASDNCGLNMIMNTYTMTSTLDGAEFPVGTTQVIWTAYDNSGTSASCTFTITVNSVTNNELLESNGIEFYPNPVKNVLTISNKNGKISAIKVMNLNGQVITVKKNVNGSLVKIDLSGLEKGMYLVEVEMNENSIIKKITVN